MIRALVILASIGAIMADGHSASMTYDVTPTAESLFMWTAAPTQNLEVKVGDTIHFRTPVGFHDVGTVPTMDELNNCDITNFDSWMGTDGAVAAGKLGTTTTANNMVDYTFQVTQAEVGDHYFLCSVAAGGHCRAGQKLKITVSEGTPASEPVKVMASAAPFWGVGLQYADMTIKLGDSVRFVSDTEGYHDVAVLVDSECPNQECCAFGQMETADRTVAYSTEDFKADDTFVWTPTEAGEYHIVCSVGAGGHCAFGQNFKVTVEDEAVETDESSAPSSAPILLLSAFGAVAASLLTH